jgi:hypothetical protein
MTIETHGGGIGGGPGDVRCVTCQAMLMTRKPLFMIVEVRPRQHRYAAFLEQIFLDVRTLKCALPLTDE